MIFGADQIFVINLESRPDRLSRVSDDLNSLGLNFERFPAYQLEYEKIAPAIYKNFNFSWLPYEPESEEGKRFIAGASGCKLSHCGVLKLAQKRGYKRVLILEDDASPADDFVERLKVYEKEFDSFGDDFELFYLGGNHEKASLVKGSIYRCELTRAAHAYLVDSSQFQELISGALASGLLIDDFYAQILQPKGNCFGFRPSLFHQRAGQSDILHTEVDYSHFT